jgi:hypothetical protein
MDLGTVSSMGLESVAWFGLFDRCIFRKFWLGAHMFGYLRLLNANGCIYLYYISLLDSGCKQ